ncbi:hypothetical protein PR001_g19703 [Phytophthora rubi]|uniref:Uncharacterized protein n=1 Tax=Phytophthora rubi TaxID=129364 RepID=A0A6A3KCD2_9STRA|nr:hypothetical protein PR001_g19703 [Phytophthora rubi]KAE9001704.1 hypothetical protein PR002_g17843 [Phytophthora rubi]
MLKLVDYEQQREDAEKTGELVRLDYYIFTTEVRRGIMTSSDMYWLLSMAMGLTVQSMTHPETLPDGMNDKQWTVTIKAAACPAEIRRTSLIVLPGTEVVIHHHSVHVNWPCRSCFAPEHPTKYCRVLAEGITQRQGEHTLKIDEMPPSSNKRAYCAKDQPRTMDQLLQLLNADRRRGRTEEKAGREKQPQRKRTQSPIRRNAFHRGGLPTLPDEWEQHRPSSPDSKATTQQQDRSSTKSKLNHNQNNEKGNGKGDQVTEGEIEGESNGVNSRFNLEPESQAEGTNSGAWRKEEEPVEMADVDMGAPAEELQEIPI